MTNEIKKETLQKHIPKDINLYTAEEWKNLLNETEILIRNYTVSRYPLGYLHTYLDEANAILLHSIKTFDGTRGKGFFGWLYLTMQGKLWKVTRNTLSDGMTNLKSGSVPHAVSLHDTEIIKNRDDIDLEISKTLAVINSTENNFQVEQVEKLEKALIVLKTKYPHYWEIIIDRYYFKYGFQNSNLLYEVRDRKRADRARDRAHNKLRQLCGTLKYFPSSKTSNGRWRQIIKRSEAEIDISYENKLTQFRERLKTTKSKARCNV